MRAATTAITFAAMLASVATTACGGSESGDTDASSDAGAHDTAAPGIDTAAYDGITYDTTSTETAGACNDLALPAPVTWTFVADSAPSALGGTIVAGSYVLTAVTTYEGPGIDAGGTPISIAERVVFSGSTLQGVAGVLGHELRVTETFTTSGSSIALTETCVSDPTSKPGSGLTFTATPTTIDIFETPTGGKVERSTYTKE
jgi:hypothetical protein